MQELLLTVSQFIGSLNAALQEIQAKVVGEVISIKIWSSGHVYFTLKDTQENATIECVMWKNTYRVNGVTLTQGMEVIISGHANIYAPQGKLSFIAQTVALVGEGTLKKAYDELKRKLTGEGLFAPERKRELPVFPQQIGVITSKQGAVIHDFSNNVGKRGFSIRFVDSRVEGKEALHDLLSAIATIRKASVDVLVIMRGGGSLQSLAAFDSEAVVRAIADFPVPVIAAIGHHQDVPLTSLAADYAVSTPTAAAHLVSKSWDMAESSLDHDTQLILNGYSEVLQREAHYLSVRQERVFRSYAYVLQQNALSLDHGEQVITANNPLRLLKHGYALVRQDGVLVKHTKDVTMGDTIEVLVSDGTINAVVGATLSAGSIL